MNLLVCHLPFSASQAAHTRNTFAPRELLVQDGAWHTYRGERPWGWLTLRFLKGGRDAHAIGDPSLCVLRYTREDGGYPCENSR